MLNFLCLPSKLVKHFLAHWQLALQAERLVDIISKIPVKIIFDGISSTGFLWKDFFNRISSYDKISLKGFFQGDFINGITYLSKKSCCRKPNEEIQSNQPCWSWWKFFQKDFFNRIFQQDFFSGISLSPNVTKKRLHCICLFINFISLIFQVRVHYFVVYSKQQVWLKIQNFRCPYQMRWPLLAPRDPEVSSNQAYSHTLDSEFHL